MASQTPQNEDPLPTPNLPPDALARIAAANHCIQLTELAILKTFIDYKIFDLIPETGSISLLELAKKVEGSQHQLTDSQDSMNKKGLSPSHENQSNTSQPSQSNESSQPTLRQKNDPTSFLLLTRFSKFLLSTGVFLAPSPGEIAHTPLSRGYREGGVPSMLLSHISNFLMPAVSVWPEFFAKHGLREPERANCIPLGLAMGAEELNFYEILKRDPKREEGFNRFLGGITHLVDLKGVYDFSWVLEKGEEGNLEEERVFIVDVGGGTGAGLKAILEDYPAIPASRCVILDRPIVIEENKWDIEEALREVQLVEGDIFQQQPIRGALIYHISRVLNDWPDFDCIRLLKHIREVAVEDSRVLIVEELLVENPSSLSLTQDIFMLGLGGKRRNEEMFGEFGRKAGWKVNGCYRGDGCGVVELVVDGDWVREMRDQNMGICRTDR